MSKALTIQRTVIPSAERARYLKLLQTKLAHFTASRCRFWVFEDAELRGAFVEFTEADDVETLAAAQANAPTSILFPIRIYEQVEIPHDAISHHKR